MKLKLTLYFVSAAIVISASASASAEETSWLTGYKALTAFRKLERQGYMPVKVQCRDSNLRQLDVGETEYNVTLVRNTENTRYLWAVGSSYGQYKLKAAKEGFRQVSMDQYTRKKSGLTVRCAIWHK